MADSETAGELNETAEVLAPLVRRYGDLVYAAARRQAGDGAEDVAQAVWMVTLRRTRDGRLPKEKFMAGWLVKVTAYAASEARRAAVRRAYHEGQVAGRRMEVQPGLDAGHAEILRVVDQGLMELRAVDREVMTRRYLCGQEVSAVAGALAMTEDSARRRIARALEKLRKILGRRGVRAPAVAIGAALAGQLAVKVPAGWAAVAVGAANQGILKLTQATLWRMTMVKVQAIALTCAAVLTAGIGAALTHSALARGPSSTPSSAPGAMLADESPVKNGLRTQITATAKTFVAGEAIPMKLEVENVAMALRHYAQRIRTLNEGLVVRDEGGRAVPYLGGPSQLMERLEPLDRGQIKEIEAFDLAAFYYLRRPGKYVVSFPGEAGFARPGAPADLEPANDGLPPSNTFHFEITAERIPDGDPAGKLLPLVRDTWKLVGKANEKAGKLKPGTNWSEVTGRRFYFLDLPTIYKRDTAFVFVWLCDEAAAPAPPVVAEENVNLNRTSEYAGKVGRWHVYVETDAPARERWPNAVEEIKKALAGKEKS